MHITESFYYIRINDVKSPNLVKVSKDTAVSFVHSINECTHFKTYKEALLFLSQAQQSNAEIIDNGVYPFKNETNLVSMCCIIDLTNCINAYEKRYKTENCFASKDDFINDISELAFVDKDLIQMHLELFGKISIYELFLHDIKVFKKYNLDESFFDLNYNRNEYESIFNK